MSLYDKPIIITNTNDYVTTNKTMVRAKNGYGFSVSEIDKPYYDGSSTTDEPISNVRFKAYCDDSCDSSVDFFTTKNKYDSTDNRYGRDRPTSSYMINNNAFYSSATFAWVRNALGYTNGGLQCGQCNGCYNSCDGCFNLCVNCTAGCTSNVTDCGSCDDCTSCVMGCQSGFSCSYQFSCTSGCFTTCQTCVNCVEGCTTGCYDSETTNVGTCTACASGCTNWASGACKVCNAACNACNDGAVTCNLCYNSLYQTGTDEYICSGHYDSGKCRNYCVNALCDPCFQCAEGTGCMGCVCGCQTYCVDGQGTWAYSSTSSRYCGQWVVNDFIQEQGNPSCTTGCTTLCVDECNASCFEANVSS